MREVSEKGKKERESVVDDDDDDDEVFDFDAGTEPPPPPPKAVRSWPSTLVGVIIAACGRRKPTLRLLKVGRR